jgi:DNA mismatch repair protein MutH
MDQVSPTPPGSEEELVGRARRLAGVSLATAAQRFGLELPESSTRGKGFAGRLLEIALGASAGSRAAPDFPELGIELKTLPVDPRGKPRESTWVCHCPLDGSLPISWSDSWVREKLDRVLWIPIVYGPDQSLGERRIGLPILWSADAEEESTLCQDYEALAERVALGEADTISARHGTALQIRPKAADGRQADWVVGEEGEWTLANPRGFYLRASFTGAMLARRVTTGG